MATNEEASRRFQFGGFSNLQDAQQFATSALQRVADMPPAIAEDQVIRLNVIDLSKFGQHHSWVLEDLRKLVTDELRLTRLLIALLVIKDVSKSNWVESPLSLCMAETIDQRPPIRLGRLVAQSVKHTSVLVMEELQDWAVSFFLLYEIVVLFL